MMPRLQNDNKLLKQAAVLQLCGTNIFFTVISF